VLDEEKSFPENRISRKKMAALFCEATTKKALILMPAEAKRRKDIKIYAQPDTLCGVFLFRT